ncbi:hypothetical protein PLANPX_2048 [Lacipirellula parvula]|uniref:Uncharacterized protein n=1 Tax=Lacipirellula parvula TaxID=2650471 RepID=A0A5K7XDF5_9BACT|nr:hypothetical protein PLANPX_2048 [Lacipirellula parvula]
MRQKAATGGRGGEPFDAAIKWPRSNARDRRSRLYTHAANGLVGIS